jgi:hypothetical protein
MRYLALVWVFGCGSVSAPQKQDAPPMCVPETDPAFCMRIGKTCEMVSDTDNCGQARSASCGVCSGSTSACVANVCTAPVCGNTFMAAPGTPITSLNTAGKQSALLGASKSGQSVLYLQATGQCVTNGPQTLTIADEAVAGSPPYVTHTLAGVANLNGFTQAEETMTLTADGLTIIGVGTGSHSFLSSTRSAVAMTDFSLAASGDFAMVNAGLPSAPATVSWPYMTSDGLAFYFQVGGATVVAMNGIYESVRASTSVAFPAATRMPMTVQGFESITGMSSDRMTAFMGMSFGTKLLTRNSLSQPFAAPATSTPPGNAWRVVPIAGCTAIGTCEPGGCQNEGICTWANQ